MNKLNQKILIFFALISAPLYLFKFSFFNIPTNALEIIIFLNIAFWISSTNGARSRDIVKIPWQISVSIAAILFGVIFATFSNDSIFSGLGVLKSWFVLPVFFAYLIFNNIKEKREIEMAFFSLYLSAVLVSIISIAYKILGHVTYDNRLAAFYSSPNYLALYLASSTILGLYFLIEAFRHNCGVLKKIALIFSYGLILISIFYTYSYASWVAIFLSIITTTLFNFNKRTFFKILAFFSTIFLFIVISQVHSEKFYKLIHFSERSSLSSRLMIWKASEKMLLDKPLSGIGPGNFQERYLSMQKFFPPYLEWAVPHPHNIFLAFWLQSSIFGLIGFIFLIIYILYSLNMKKSKTTSIKLVMFSFFLYIIFHGMVDTPFWKNDLAFIFWVYVGLFLAEMNISKNKQEIGNKNQAYPLRHA